MGKLIEAIIGVVLINTGFIIPGAAGIPFCLAGLLLMCHAVMREK